MNNIPAGKELNDQSGVPPWGQSYDEEVIKVNNQSVMNDSLETIWYSGPRERNIIGEKIEADIASGSNHNNSHFKGGC